MQAYTLFQKIFVQPVSNTNHQDSFVLTTDTDAKSYNNAIKKKVLYGNLINHHPIIKVND